MNFPIRDNIGEVNEVERKKNLSKSVTVDDFIQHSQGKTLQQLQFEDGPADPAVIIDSEVNLGFGVEQSITIEVSEQGRGPLDHRYIQDVHNPGRVIDMRHFIESADIALGQGELLGLGIEIQQGITDALTKKDLPSAWEKEDINSNFLGAVFRNNYFDPDGEISDQFQEFFTDYEKGELKGFHPTLEYFVDDVIDLGKDASRALKELLEITANQQVNQTERDAKVLIKILDKLKSHVDQPVYAEDVEDGFDQAEDQVQRRYYDPLILDLDGDGIELTSVNDLTVRFDIDGDGFREATGWVNSNDGFLVFDRNKDGYINDISELFGNQTTSGFTELQELDSNNDGQITAADNNFADLQVWRDLDQDGYSDVIELFTLEEYGITRIDAVGNSANINIAGNRINETASFEFADGTQHQVANVLFNIDQQNSYYDPYSTFNSKITITQEILNLPNLRGYGNLPDLSIAMAKDSELQTLVESLTENINSGDIAAARELVRPIMLTWAGIDKTGVSNNYIGAFTQELEFLEKFVGRDWNNNNPTWEARETIRNTFAQLERELETRLLAQVVESSVSYNTTAERYEFSGDINGVFEQFKQVVTDSSATSNFEASALSELIKQEAKANNWIFSEFATNEDVTLEILATDLVGTESDLDTSNLSFSSIKDAVKGIAVINEAGNIEFTSTADYYGIAVFEYTVTDGAKSFTGLAQVNVSPVNDAPVANNDTAATEEDTAITILATQLLSNDSDIENDALRIHRVNNTVNGTANVNAEGNIQFTPDANFNGTATIEYSISDGIEYDTASIEINVSPVNDAPIANNDIATAIDEDTSITILKSELLANDRDLEGDSLSIINVSSDSGTATLNTDGNIEFSPKDNFNGTATLNYTVSDGIDSSTASVEVNINPVNDVPILTQAIPNLTLDKNAAKSEIDLAAYFDDIENGSSLNYSFQVSSSFQGGTSGQFFDDFSYNPTTKKLTLGYSQGVTGTSTITVTATDSSNESVETSFTVSLVEPVNKITLNNDTVTTDQDATTTILATQLLSNDTGDNLRITGVNNSVNGTAIIDAAGNIEFTPNPNFSGQASFDYIVNDGTENDRASVEVIVNSANQILTLVNPISDFTVAQNAPNSVIKLSNYFQNADNLSYDFSVSSYIQDDTSSQFFDNFAYDPTTKSLVLDYADGVIGTSNITVKATDNNSNESIETTFTVSVVDSHDGTTDSNRVLTLGYANDVIGKSTITINVTDGGNELVETAFTVSVIDVSETGDVLLGEDGNDYLLTNSSQ